MYSRYISLFIWRHTYPLANLSEISSTESLGDLSNVCDINILKRWDRNR